MMFISKHKYICAKFVFKSKTNGKYGDLLQLQVFVRESGMNNTTPMRPWTYVLIRIQDYEKGKREDSAVTFTKAVGS